MDKFDSHYAAAMKELSFPRYNNNIFIDVHMVHFFDGDKQLKIDQC